LAPEHDDPRTALVRSLLELAPADAEEAGDRDQIVAFVRRHERPFDRAIREGHLTGSAITVSADGSRVLLLHHRKLDRWLQPGGHADGDTDLARVALKEAEEETGVHALVLHAELFDVDRHWIPEHKGVPAHWHYDVRYVVRAQDEGYVVSDESHDLAWRPVAQLAGDPDADPSVRRMAGKWLAAMPPAAGTP